MGAQRGFVADASHQLRTPLAAMRLRLENLEADVDGAAAEDLEGALAEVSRLSRLVDGLLVLMRAEQSTSDPAPVVVEDVLDGRCDAWDAFAAEKHVHIDASVAGTPVASATPGRLEQVVDNLLNNALEVAPPGSAVRVVAGSHGDWVELRVSDEGPGMSAEERAHAFDRFWQSGAGAARRSPQRSLRARARRSCASSWWATAVTSRSAPSAAGGLEVVVRMKRSDAPVAPRARQLSTASAT